VLVVAVVSCGTRPCLGSHCISRAMRVVGEVACTVVTILLVYSVATRASSHLANAVGRGRGLLVSPLSVDHTNAQHVRTSAFPLALNLLVKLLQCKWAQVRCGKGETGVVNSGSVIELIKK
jgi:hypothetical protein